MWKSAQALEAPMLINEETILDQCGKVVLSRTFRFPDGHKKFIVWGGKNAVPVIIFPLTAGGEVVAIRQFRWGANDLIVEVPGGNPKGNQTSHEVVRDELKEETGFKSGKVITLGSGRIWSEPGSCITPYIPVLALDCAKDGEQNLDPTEIIATALVPLREWRAMIRSGEICDGKTITVTHLALDWLGTYRPDLIR